MNIRTKWAAVALVATPLIAACIVGFFTGQQKLRQNREEPLREDTSRVATNEWQIISNVAISNVVIYGVTPWSVELFDPPIKTNAFSKSRHYPASPELRSYFLREKLVDPPSSGNLLKALVEAVPGVVEVALLPYELSVWKTPAYSWEEVEPAINEAITEWRK